MSPRRRPRHLRAYPPIERERHQLTPDQVPPSPESTQRVGDHVGRVMKQMGLDQRLWTAQVADEWEALVGASLAKQTRPGDLEDGRLTVFVSHSLWLNELRRYSGAMLLKNLQNRFGANRIRTVLYKLDPGDPV